MTNVYDPYAGNLLVQGLGPILSRQEALAALAYFPPVPAGIKNIPVHIRLHALMALRDLHLPTLEGARLYSTIDLMLRQGYRYRDPLLAETWRMVSGMATSNRISGEPATAAIASGFSGTGKTVGIKRALNIYPQQIIRHATFPNMAREFYQVVWLSVDVPSSGKPEDLGANLMMAWDAATNGHRFRDSLNRSRKRGVVMLDEWRQVASSHFLGILHLDEVQNFFKILTLKERQSKKKKGENLDLRIIEDACLKWILSLTNTWRMPLMLSGTPDGVEALTKRFSTGQRLVTGGYHAFSPFKSGEDLRFADVFLPHLLNYQFVASKLPKTKALGELIIELTAGIPRLIIALWIAAHRVAFERSTDDLRLEDFKIAAATYLGFVSSSVAALRSSDPLFMSRYEDLMPRDDGFWQRFWSELAK
jgi:hypothetical protein